jgi:hypothetical protein
VRILTSLKGYLAAIVLLAVLAGTEGALYVQLQSSYSSLSRAYNDVQDSYSSLQSDYSSLDDTYNALRAEYNSLSVNYTSLRSSYYELHDDYGLLEQTYNNLQGNYETETTLRIGNSLASYYDILRKESGSWQSNTQMAQFAAKLALHSLGHNCWPSLENEFYQDVSGHSYDMAWAILDTVLGLTGANTTQTPTERIRRILNFVNQHIHYEYDVEDILLAPAETLGFKSGDCDDFTILAAALFRAVGIDCAVSFYRHQDPGAEKQYHWMVLVHLDNLGEYGYWYYSDLTSMGLEAGTWIKIEPQDTIENQRSEWVGQWNLLAAAPLD